VKPPIFRLDSRERWRPQPVETVERLATIDGRPVSVAALPPGGGRMNFPAHMQDPTDTAVVGYHRVVRAAYLFWHQFWLWYLYNPWSIAGAGRHEGDWEFVQAACTDAAGDRPVLMTASQHRTGEKREFWRCETVGGRPVVYVARHSHANFFTPGDRGDDVADGRGRELTEVEWRPFAPWSAWPGRWGNSTGVGRSPDSPANQGIRWRRPETWHAGVR
jgi:hypothetical protein